MTYEVYFTDICNCDRQWPYLGRVQADNEDVAMEEARRLWPDYPSEYLVCIPVVEYQAVA